MRHVLLVLLASSAVAADSWSVIPEQSSVRFSGTSTLHDFAGTAKLVDGAVRLDATDAGGRIEADTASMDTAHKGRDKKMHGEIMEADTWPRITFELVRIEPSPDGMIAHGWWTMHGVARNISIPLRLSAGEPRHAKASFTVDIRRWDIPIPRAALVISVDPSITVDLDVALKQADGSALPAAIPHDLAGCACEDKSGVRSLLADQALGTVVILHTSKGAGAAKIWRTNLSALLGTKHQPIQVLDASDQPESKHAALRGKLAAGNLVEFSGAIRRRLLLPRRDAIAIVVDREGKVQAIEDGSPSADTARRLVGLLDPDR